MGSDEHEEVDTEPEKRDLRDRRSGQQRVKRVLATSKHLEQLTKQTRRLAGEDEDETQPQIGDGGILDGAKGSLLSLKQRHALLRERLTSPTDESMGFCMQAPGKHARVQLQREFDFAVLKSTECEVDGDEWDDGVVASLWEAMEEDSSYEEDLLEIDDSDDVPAEPYSMGQRFAYRVHGRTVICGLSRRRIGIRFETCFAGVVYESYYCALASKSSSDKLSVVEHTVPFFLPLRETEKGCLAGSPKLFIDTLGAILQAYVSRRQQLNLLKDTRGDQVGEVYSSLPYTSLVLCLEVPDAKVKIMLGYDEMLSELPTRCEVIAWPLLRHLQSSTKGRRGVRRGQTALVSHQLQAAQSALQSIHLHEAYDQVVADVRATVAVLDPNLMMSPGLA